MNIRTHLTIVYLPILMLKLARDTTGPGRGGRHLGFLQPAHRVDTVVQTHHC